MSEWRLVIFDCDGTLVDSEEISTEVLARSLTEHGLPTTTSEAQSEYQGLLLSEIDALAQARLGRPLPSGWLEAFERDRAERFRRELRPVLGAAATVREIEAAGIAVCVASQGKLEKTRLTLELTGLRELFAEEQLFSAWSVARGKPHPDLFLHAAATMGVEPARLRGRRGLRLWDRGGPRGADACRRLRAAGRRRAVAGRSGRAGQLARSAAGAARAGRCIAAGAACRVQPQGAEPVTGSDSDANAATSSAVRSGWSIATNV